LQAVLAITVLHSIGTGVSWHVIFYIAKHELAYTQTDNLALALVLGGSYTFAAFLSGAILRRVGRRRAVSLRTTLAALMLASAALAAVPAVFGEVGLWLYATVYMMLTGIVWPTVEAFLAGGRGGRALRSASGRFNVSWSSATFLAMLLASPLVERAPDVILYGLACVHVLTLLPVALLPPNAGAGGGQASPDPGDTNAPSPALARGLLAAFRSLNFASYMLAASLAPVLPHMLDSLRVEIDRQAALGGTWALTRVAAFVLFERWHGWHASRLTPIGAGLLLAAGVLGAFASPNLPVLIASLAVLGVGMGVSYAGAIYYALHAEAGHVDAGGKHEAIIGLGYTLGPLVGFGLVSLFA
jgi:MFS family permease